VIDRSKPINIQVKQIFIKGLGNTLPNDSAAFMSGILIGSRSALPTVFTDILIALGLSHIIAVSGYNLTILVGFLNKRLAKDWRWGGLVASLWIILGFVIISGSSASILRAGIMSAVFLIANHYGRRLNLIVCLCITAVAMIAVQPQSVLSDIGWQLSFLSHIGITLLAPRISKLLPSKPRLLNDILSVTLAAQIATAGLVIYKFDQISVLAPISNLFILPLIPSLMLLGVIAALFGLILPQFAYLYFGKFVHVIFTTIFDFLTYLSKWQVSVIQFSNFSVWSVVIYYAVICIFALLVRSKSEYSFIGVNRDKINRENNSLNKVIDKGELSVRA
jgi:competence protein ComEC